MLFLFFISSCNHEGDALIGTWTVNKVHVSFDESKTNPDIVKQTGELERDNMLVIGADSVLTLYSQNDTILHGKITLNKNGAIFIDNICIGQWSDRLITTKEDTPYGLVTVTYQKK